MTNVSCNIDSGMRDTKNIKLYAGLNSFAGSSRTIPRQYTEVLQH